MAGISATARQAVYAPLDGGGRVDAVIERLSGAIAVGLIDDGEQLPREVELASSLGVSTVTLREALVQLRHLGVVKTRRGRAGGSFVHQPRSFKESASRQRLRELGGHEIRDLGDLQLAIGGMAAMRAAQRASHDEIHRLEQLVEALAIADSLATRRQADGRFQVEIASAGQSVRLALLTMNVQAEYGDLIWLPFPGEDGSASSFHERAVADNRAVLDAIRDGNAEAARALAERHIENGIERLLDLHFILADD